jgi:putative ABC transport system permease protein
MKSKLQPPLWIDRFLQWRLPEEQYEEVQGDMQELYGQWVEGMGEKKARRRYFLNAVTFLRPLPKPKSIKYHNQNGYLHPNLFYMISNYLKIACRNLLRHKSFSILNILGLTLGLTACLLIALFVWDELQYDKFLPEGDRVYRIYNDMSSKESGQIMAVTPPMFGATLGEDFPEVETVTRILLQPWDTKRLIEVGDKQVYETGGLVVDSTFLEVFPLSMVYGSRVEALHNPNSIVISDRFSAKYFGNEDPVGKQVLVNKNTFYVKGVFKHQDKFHIPVQFLFPLSAAGFPADRMKSWGWSQFYTYVRLKKGVDVAATQAKFRDVVLQQVDQSRNEPYTYKPYFQALHDVYLHSSHLKYNGPVSGNITYVKALSIIALFVLLIACFNFVNLATAKSMKRAREVGVRKSVGASRKQLIFQFLGETVLLTFISVVLAGILCALFLPLLNRFTEKTMSFNIFSNPLLILILLALTLVAGIGAGFYPAMVLSGFKPVKVLKGDVLRDAGLGKVSWVRHGLIVVQFALSIFLIVSAMVVFRQVSYLHKKDLGFNKEQIMFFPMRGQNLKTNYEAFKNELLKSPGISHVSIGYGFPGDATAGDGIIVPQNGQHIPHSVTQLMVDYDYIHTLDVQVVGGRAFNRSFATDANHAFMINETAVKNLGFGTPQEALGKTLFWNVWSQEKPDSLKEGKIIGVVKDFHFKSLYDKVDPTVLQIFPPAYSKVAVKLQTTDIGNTLNHVQDVWNNFSPDYPIEYRFLDENFEQMYKSEDKLKSLLWIFTGITIFVACLGLFGLAAYAAERRQREIGIRKVLGASVEGIVLLLSRDFVKLVVVALLIASPIAWYAMNKWLEDFAYRIELEWWIFAIAGLLAIVIALLTVSFQSVKAALMNPVKSLRSE